MLFRSHSTLRLEERGVMRYCSGRLVLDYDTFIVDYKKNVDFDHVMSRYTQNVTNCTRLYIASYERDHIQSGYQTNSIYRLW